ncbi:OmpA family protein [Asticcacaulis sp. EMRT-3]|uniref:OmpA family protein n=1 Tax=Asticcacaulis sp. EMRT-3 TaxID=3040349 RepID=UPI0024AF4D28|nr:OmpA family protein [Asticcacaulis sp. EMRT-3]MDI7774242.1 OmpA family protein [Asticcacaulis sp. EMRT-3]
MQAGAVWFLGVLGLAGLSAAAVVNVLPAMQADLQSSIDKALLADGLGHVSADVSGQSVILRLKDKNPAHAAELLRAKTLVEGVAIPGEIRVPRGGILLNRPVSSVTVAEMATPPVPANSDHSALPAAQTQASSVAAVLATPETVGGERATVIAASGDLPRVAGDAAQEASVLAARSCEDRVRAVVNDRRVDFEPGTYELTGSSLDLVHDVYRVVAACPAHARVTVAGYTDNVGDGTVNQLISQARAQAVADALVADGLKTGQVTVRGFGAALPVADNSTVAGREQNRRVVFSVNAG